MNLFTPYHRFI